jgi:succinate dehydrogenase / fumarate reductase cytochrome b subunit
MRKIVIELSSVGKKFIMGFTGLFLCLFLVVHLGGNFLLLRHDNGAAFNAYSHFMETSWIIRIIEFVLLGVFVIHIVMAFILAKENRSARPIPYAVNKASENSSWFSRYMEITGGIIFIFLCVHLYNFLISQRFFHDYPSMYAAVKTIFHNPWYCAFYVICLVWVGLHLIHGFQSSFQSFGFRHPVFFPWIQRAGLLFVILIFSGFIFIPIYLYFAKSSTAVETSYFGQVSRIRDSHLKMVHKNVKIFSGSKGKS